MKKLFLLILPILFASCLSNENDQPTVDDSKDYDLINDEQIQSYLTANNLTAEKSSTGLYYIIENGGTGDAPTNTSNVTVSYKAYFLDGRVFDQANDVTFNLQQVITGFREGLLLLQEGGKATLLLPSKLGYREFGSSNGTVPPNTSIVFDVELVKVN